MSEAFDRAMKEMDRVWDASDKFDTKVLQFVGFVMAGFLAGAGAILSKLQVALPLPGIVSVLLAFGTAGVFVFVAVSLNTVIGYKFKAPLDPEKLNKARQFLTDDAGFREVLLPAIAEAHRDGVLIQSSKSRRFRRACYALAIGVVCLAGACMLLLLLHNGPGGDATMSTKTSEGTTTSGSGQGSSQSPQKPAETTTSPLGPYTIDRSAPDDSSSEK